MFRLQCESLVYVLTSMWFTSTCSDSNVMSYITLHTMLYTRLYTRFYIMLYTMLYIMLYTMPYTRLYTGLYTRLYIMLYIMLYTRLYIGHEKGGWFKIMPYSLPGSWVPQVSKFGKIRFGQKEIFLQIRKKINVVGNECDICKYIIIELNIHFYILTW